MRYVAPSFMWRRVRNLKWLNELYARGRHITTGATSVFSLAWLCLVTRVEMTGARGQLHVSTKKRSEKHGVRLLIHSR